MLGGITRDTVMQLAREHGIEVRETAIPRELLYLADELFFTGTAVEVTPIRSVDRIPVGTGKRGPITERLQQAFFGLFTGATPGSQWGWLDVRRHDARSARRVAGRRSAAWCTLKTLFQKVWEQHEVVPETRRHARGAVHRRAPDPRGHLAAGLHACCASAA